MKIPAFKSKLLQKARPLFLAIFFISLLAGKTPALSARDDWQYWNEFALKARLTERTHLSLKGEQRLRDDFSRLFLANVDAGIFFAPVRYLEFGPSYKFESEKPFRGQRTSENRLSLEATLKYPIRKLEMSDRNRVEYRNISGRQSWRYRNQFRAAYRIPVKKKELIPFVSEEIFYDTVPGELNQNRVALGLEWAVHRHFSIQLYYLLRSKKAGSDWDQSHILGTGLTVKV